MKACHLARVNRQKSTIDDVADAAGVARVTVSRVLNNEQNVRPETRAKVLRAVEELGYSVNRQARALASGAGRTILLIHSYDAEREPNSYYHSGLELGALRACAALGFDLVTRTIDPGSDQRLRLLSLIIERERPAGIVLPPPLSDDLELLSVMRQTEVRVVAVSAGKAARSVISSAGIDERAGGQAIGEYLISLGHRRLGFIKGPPEHLAAALRFDGFADALQRGGVIEHPWTTVGDFTFKSGVEAAEQMLRDNGGVTALACANDDMAAGAMLALHRAGLDIPTDISVTGFDDTPMSEVIWPPLTTLHQPIKDIAERAVRMMIESAVNAGARYEALQHKLVIRQSTAAPRQHLALDSA